MKNTHYTLFLILFHFFLANAMAINSPNTTPTLYTVTGGGTYCTGGTPLSVGLSGSQAGVIYQLKLNGNNDGLVVSGSSSGSAISFGNKTAEGTYTVFATHTATSGTATMTGSASIIVNTVSIVQSNYSPVCYYDTIKTTVPSVNRHAAFFDGVDDYIDFGNGNEITTTTFTVEAWIYPTGFRTNVYEGNIVTKENNGGANANGFMFRSGGAGILEFAVGGPGGATLWHNVISDANALVLNTWQHVAGVYDGTTSPKTLALYVNGILVKTSSTVTVTSIGASNPITLRIGNWGTSAARAFKGAIDEVRIWNIVRSQTELQNNKDKHILATTPGLRYYMQLDEGYGGKTKSVGAVGGTGIFTNYSAGAAKWAREVVAPAAVIPTVHQSPMYLWATGATTIPPIVASSSGSYTLTATTTEGCAATNTIATTVVNCNNIVTTNTLSCESVSKTNVTGNKWFDFPGSNGIVVSINPGTLNLGTVTVEVSDPTGTINFGKAYLGRSFNIMSSAYASGVTMPSTYSMRIYYYDTELTEYNTATSGSYGLPDFYVDWREGGSGCALSTYGGTGTGTITAANVAEVDYGTSNNGFYLQYNLNHFTMFAATTGATILPLELISFSGKKAGDENHLFWKTANEINVNRIEIQRLNTKNNQFETIGSVIAQNRAANYTFIDKKPYDLISYYRLNTLDKDGSNSFSKTILIENEHLNQEKNLHIYPNPATDLVTIENAPEDATIEILNNLGQVILSKTMDIQEKTLDIHQLSNGIYFVRVGQEMKRLVVERGF